MQNISFVRITLSSLMMLIPCKQVAASAATPYTPTTKEQVEGTLNTTFKPGTELRKKINSIPGLTTNEEVSAFLSDFSIRNIYDEVSLSEGFVGLSSSQKQHRIWQEIEKKMLEKTSQALGAVEGVKPMHINKLVAHITENAFLKGWDEGDWATIVSTQEPTHSPNVSAFGPEPSTDKSFNPTTLSSGLDGARTLKAPAADDADTKTPSPDLGQSPKNNTGKQTDASDTKKTFKLSEYRKTIIAGIALVGLSAWLYSKYSHTETQNAMNAATTA